MDDTAAVPDEESDLALLAAEALLARYLEGEEPAFAELVARTGDRLFSFLRRFLGDPTEAEDVYQNVWIKVATRAELYDPQARFETWLYTIARNACLDALRARARRRDFVATRRDDPDEPATEIPSDADPPDRGVSDAELGLRIARAVEALPTDQREVFLLKEEGDLTFEEIGELLGCGKETAKSRMRYAIARLRGALGAEARAYGLAAGRTT